MDKIELIATATFGLEAIVKREIEKLGYHVIKSEDAKITFAADRNGIARSNLNLRCADRVLLKMGEFEALSFEELFQRTREIPWEKWIPENGKFPVSGTSVKSKLYSVSDCQAIVKKAIVEKMKEHYNQDWFEETGAEYPVKITILKDRVTLTIDTSGVGLHKRGYRAKNVMAPMKETLASALIQLSFWKQGRLLVDPFCGSGTIAIEAAMYERNIAPGLDRKFISEEWDSIPVSIWKEERIAALAAIRQDVDIRITASDIDPAAVAAARKNAVNAGVEDCINFEVKALSALEATEEYGIIICNPPYGERIGEAQEIKKIYNKLKRFMENNPTWSLYVLTADKNFEAAMGNRKPDRKRKLFNGRIETCYYQYYGKRPV